MKHTQGKWEVGDSIIVKEQAFIANLQDRNGDHIGCCVIANVPTDSVTREQAEANATLIAAAPELLDACEAQIACNKAKDKCEGCERESVCHGDMLPSFMLTSAIAKATT